MDILHQLVNHANFPQLQPLIVENAKDDVLETFYACWLAMMADGELAQSYETFVQSTASQAQQAMTTGEMMTGTADFLTKNAHAKIAQHLAEYSFVNEAAVSTVLPLAVHQAMQYLSAQGNPHHIAAQVYDEIVPLLPSWGRHDLPAAALNPIRSQASAAASTVIDTQIDDLVHQAKSGVAVDAVIGGDFVEFDSAATAVNHEQSTPMNKPYQNQPPAEDYNPFAHNIHAEPASDIDNGNDEDNSSDDTDGIGNQHLIPNPPKKSRAINPVMIAVPVLLLGVLAAGAWYYLQHKSPNATNTPTTAAAPSITAKLSAELNITVGENGELYACRAQLGNSALQEQFMSVLNGSFHAATCVLDINDSFSGELDGMDKLPSVIALLKSVRFASLELTQGQLLIHSPNSDDTARLVRDIAALVGADGITVSAMPAHNPAEAIRASLERGRQALAALPMGEGGFALARAMSLPIVDFGQDGQMAADNQAFLSSAAEQLKASPNMRLIIAAHTSAAADDRQALLLSQERADAVRAYLIGEGVSESQLVAQGVGARFAVADNETELGRFKNNRIEFLEYDENIMQALSSVATEPVQMGEPPLEQGQVLFSANQAETANDIDAPIYSEVNEQPPAQATMSTQPNHTPTYDVQNGVIVQQPQVYDNGLPQGISPAPINGQSARAIDDDLLKPIGSDGAGTPAVRLE
ncbi:MAG: OmpA family protein [Moraxella sp.]|nr:OmpA family protein [Moraxella sp.]